MLFGVKTIPTNVTAQVLKTTGKKLDGTPAKNFFESVLNFKIIDNCKKIKSVDAELSQVRAALAHPATNVNPIYA